MGHRSKSLKLLASVSPKLNIWDIIRLPDSVWIVLRAYQRCYTQTIRWIILRIDLKTAQQLSYTLCRFTSSRTLLYFLPYE